jgi:ribulose kinase
MKKAKKISKTTTNRSVYNRAHKHDLEHSGKIRCSYCEYHKNENYDGHCYGGFEDDNLKRPNWKLVSKNKKQWQKKTSKINKTISKVNGKVYLTIKI